MAFLWPSSGRLPVMVEVKHLPGGPSVRFRCRLLERWPGGVALFYVVDQPWRVADLCLRPGVATFAYYWRARWYNVYHWVSPEGGTVACYVNIATPARLRAQEVEWYDLGVDLLVRPGRGPEVLDVEELKLLSAPLRARAHRSLKYVLRRWGRIVGEVESLTRRLYARVTG